jgi:catechol 2,3-dioxygenase-like lactoylglutathione lyase family enzyme
MSISSFDHVAIPTSDPEAMMRFYRSLGFEVPDFAAWRSEGTPYFSMVFGENKINVHAPELWQGGKFDLRGPTAVPGCGDFCFVWSGTIGELRGRLREVGAEIVKGPVERVGGRAGGTAKGTSIYTRDPDQNLLEFIVYTS